MLLWRTDSLYPVAETLPSWEEAVQSLSFPQTSGWWGSEDGVPDLSDETCWRIASCWNSKFPCQEGTLFFIQGVTAHRLL